jgi:hypothetical protein
MNINKIKKILNSNFFWLSEKTKYERLIFLIFMLSKKQHVKTLDVLTCIFNILWESFFLTI